MLRLQATDLPLRATRPCFFCPPHPVRLRIPKIEPRVDAGLKVPMRNARKGADVGSRDNSL
jgi:hypothetical protein